MSESIVVVVEGVHVRSELVFPFCFDFVMEGGVVYPQGIMVSVILVGVGNFFAHNFRCSISCLRMLRV